MIESRTMEISLFFSWSMRKSTYIPCQYIVKTSIITYLVLKMQLNSNLQFNGQEATVVQQLV